MERPEDNLQEPSWKRIIGNISKQTIVNKIRSVYNLPLIKPSHAQSDLFNKLQFGEKTHKVIMMIGQTGAGKSTLINGMINYILGVEWKDNVRIKLIEEDSTGQAEAQTSKVTCYEINHQEGFKIPYSLTAIDTPGFGYSGIEEGKQIVTQIRECFTSPAGVQHIDAVCFVISDLDIRLTDALKYVVDSVLRIFGKDMEENIICCVTHCDDSEEPEVINTVVKASVPCVKDEQDRPVYFRFNNSDIPVHSDNEINGGSSKIREMQWEETMENMEKFFIFLPNLNTRSLTLTQEVLKERRALQIILEGLYLQSICNIQSEREALKLIETAKKCLQRLQEIALKPGPLTITDYIDLLINDEAITRKPGYIERIKSLEKLKQQITERETKNQK